MKITEKFKKLPFRKKIQVIGAVVLTAAVLTVIPIYAWFSQQKKAAEMYKIKYPNSLYINAAHREDQIMFDLGGIKMGEHRKNAAGQWVDSNGDPVENMADAELITEQRYVFSVSGSNTTSYILQLAHTTNNGFTYELRKATQKYYPKGTSTRAATESSRAITEADVVQDGDDVIEYKLHPDAHTENPLQVVWDDDYADAPGDYVYYVVGNVVSGSIMNDSNNDGLADTDNTRFYNPNYAGNTNVQANAVPIYWQGTCTTNPDSNRNFCDYYILTVKWNGDRAVDADKETDMVYLSVERVS